MEKYLGKNACACCENNGVQCGYPKHKWCQPKVDEGEIQEGCTGEILWMHLHFLQKKLYTYATIPAVLKCHKDVKSDMLFSILIGNTYLNIFICIRVVHVQSTDDWIVKFWISRGSCGLR